MPYPVCGCPPWEFFAAPGMLASVIYFAVYEAIRSAAYSERNRGVPPELRD
jgi:hypothetical protein